MPEPGAVRPHRSPYGWRGLAGDAAGGTVAALICARLWPCQAQLMGRPPAPGLFTSILTAPITAVLGRNPVLIGGTAARRFPSSRMERADATAFLVTAAAVLATNAVAAVATAGCFMPPETFWKNLPQCRGSWPGFESEPSSLERRISDHLLTGKPRTSRFAWRMANLQEINSTRPTVPAVPRDSSRSCQGWPGWWGFLREQERWAIEPDHALVDPCHAVRYIPKPRTGSR